MRPATTLAMITALRKSSRLNDMVECPLPPRERGSRLKLILDLRAVTLELRAYPQVRFVIQNAACVIGRDERVARYLNLASANHNLLVGELACADTNDAPSLCV